MINSESKFNETLNENLFDSTDNYDSPATSGNQPDSHPKFWSSLRSS